MFGTKSAMAEQEKLHNLVSYNLYSQCLSHAEIWSFANVGSKFDMRLFNGQFVNCKLKDRYQNDFDEEKDGANTDGTNSSKENTVSTRHSKSRSRHILHTNIGSIHVQYLNLDENYNKHLEKWVLRFLKQSLEYDSMECMFELNTEFRLYKCINRSKVHTFPLYKKYQDQVNNYLLYYWQQQNKLQIKTNYLKNNSKNDNDDIVETKINNDDPNSPSSGSASGTEKNGPSERELLMKELTNEKVTNSIELEVRPLYATIIYRDRRVGKGNDILFKSFLHGSAHPDSKPHSRKGSMNNELIDPLGQLAQSSHHAHSGSMLNKLGISHVNPRMSIDENAESDDRTDIMALRSGSLLGSAAAKASILEDVENPMEWMLGTINFVKCRFVKKKDKAGAKSEKEQKINDLSLGIDSQLLTKSKGGKRRASLSYRGGPGGGSRRKSRTLRGGGGRRSSLKMQSPGDLFLKDRVSNNTAAGGGIAIGSNSNTSQSPSSPGDGVGRMGAISEISFIPPSNLLNQEMIGQACIKVNITQHLTDMGWNPKYNKSILEILNDNIYFNENTSEWYMDYYVHLDNKHEVRIYQKPIDNMPSVDDMVAQLMQEAAASDTDDNSQAYVQKMPIGSRSGDGSVVRHPDGDSQFTTPQPSPQPQLDPYVVAQQQAQQLARQQLSIIQAEIAANGGKKTPEQERYEAQTRAVIDKGLFYQPAVFNQLTDQQQANYLMQQQMMLQEQQNTLRQLENAQQQMEAAQVAQAQEEQQQQAAIAGVPQQGAQAVQAQQAALQQQQQRGQALLSQDEINDELSSELTEMDDESESESESDDNSDDSDSDTDSLNNTTKNYRRNKNNQNISNENGNVQGSNDMMNDGQGKRGKKRKKGKNKKGKKNKNKKGHGRRNSKLSGAFKKTLRRMKSKENSPDMGSISDVNDGTDNDSVTPNDVDDIGDDTAPPRGHLQRRPTLMKIRNIFKK